MKNELVGFFFSRRKETKLAIRGEKKRNSCVAVKMIFRDEKKRKYLFHDEKKRNSPNENDHSAK